MGVIARRWQESAEAALNPGDDRLYTGYPTSYQSMAGTTVTEESALRISTVFSCVKIISEALAQLPIKVYRELPEDKGRDSVDSPLAERLHHLPNEEQSDFEFKEQMQQWACLRPYAYAEVTLDGQMWPRHPDRIKAERLKGSKRLRYQYLEDDGTWRPILWEDMLRVPGSPVLQYARESFGLAQAIEAYGSKSFANGVRPSGIVTTTKVLDENGRDKLRTWIEEGNAGSERSGRVMILPEDMKFVQLGMSNQDAEFIASRVHSITDIARWFRIPAYMLDVLQPGAVSYASIEMQSIEFVVFTMMPWFKRWEGAIWRDLIGQGEEYAEFLLAGLLRGTTKDRYDAYSIGIQWGWLSPNDVRRFENMNPIPGGDDYKKVNAAPELMPGQPPKQLGPGQKPGQPPQQQQKPGQPPQRAADMDEGSPASNLLNLFMEDAAGRAVRREVAAMSRIAEKHGDDEVAFNQAAVEFYDRHADYVADALHLPAGEARRYAQSKVKALREDGITAAAAWETEDIHRLTELAMEVAR